MNYAQEKYTEANDTIEPITGLRLASRDIDRILSIFATVPQVTTPNERVSIQKLAPLVCGGQRLCDAWEAIDRVLAERGPVIAAQPVIKLTDDSWHQLSGDGKAALLTRENIDGVLSRQAYRANLSKLEPPVTLLDPTGGKPMEVPASIVHEMDYPEANTYTRPAIFTQDFTFCDSCGCVVFDQEKHTEFHERAVR